MEDRVCLSKKGIRCIRVLYYDIPSQSSSHLPFQRYYVLCTQLLFKELMAMCSTSSQRTAVLQEMHFLELFNIGDRNVVKSLNIYKAPQFIKENKRIAWINQVTPLIVEKCLQQQLKRKVALRGRALNNLRQSREKKKKTEAGCFADRDVSQSLPPLYSQTYTQ